MAVDDILKKPFEIQKAFLIAYVILHPTGKIHYR
jgi:hypothetical protein